MSDPDPPDPSADGPDLKSFAKDWITIWHSECAATAADRETQEQWQTLLGVWAEAANSMVSALPDAWTKPRPSHGSHEQRASAAAAARPAAADAPSDARDDAVARDDEVARLGRRIAELERRLAELERGGG